MTIKSRIAFGIAFLLTTITLLGVLGHHYLARIEERNAQAYRDNYLQLTALEEVQSQLTRVSSGLILERDPLTQRTVERFAEAVEMLASKMSSRSGDAARTRAQTTLLEDLELVEQVARRQLGGNAPQGDEQRRRLRSLLDEASSALHVEFELNQQAVAYAFADTEATTQQARKRIILLGAICVLFAAAILIWLPGYVTAPFKAFERSVDEIGRGEYTHRLRVDRSDEFGRLAEAHNAMLDQLEEQSRERVGELIASRNQLRGLVNELDDMILGMDPERTIVFMNANMERYLDLHAEDALGQYMPDLALTKPRLQQLFEPIALGQARAIEPFELTDARGRRVFYQERVVELRNADGKLTGYIITLSDVTDYEEKTNRQTDFLATLSHEMKTPISAIKMSLNLLEDTRLGELDEDQRELTETIRSNSERLLRMVNEVLRHSENESGEVRLDLQPVALEDLLVRCVAQVQPLALEKALTIAASAEPELPIIEADPMRIEWVVNNVLSNAIRYAPTGSTVEIDLYAVPGGVHLVVSDRGPGVPAGEEEAIFEKYRRATGDTTKGTGLGLAISREYVEAHRGRIYLDEAYTDGARFVLELPRVLPEELRRRHGVEA